MSARPPLWAPLRAALALALALGALPARAEPPVYASLVADSLKVEGNSVLVASGHVEVLYKGTRLRATALRYDRSTDRMSIDGPILITDPSGAVFTAESADLSGDLSEGMLTSARLVLEQQLQIAAGRIVRTGGRYTVLGRTIASSCEVCAAHPVPDWEIRASRIIHDSQEHQLYFDNATLRIAGVPVAYIPRLRMPDPSVKRAPGFLLPEFRSTTLLGAGLKLPYFIPLGDSRDLTVTPYLATGRTATLGLRYRQAYANGGLEATGALTSDSIRPGTPRGYLFADGHFALQNGYKLRFQVRTTSDDAYLSDYGISTQDRLRSLIEITRTSRDAYSGYQINAFHTLRAGEDSATLPWFVGALTTERRFSPPLLGGEAGFTVSALAATRSSAADVAGRDVARGSVGLSWRRSWVLPGGVLATALASARADLYGISQDSGYPDSIGRLLPAAGVELRWPLVRPGKGGAAQVLEPVLQVIWSPETVTSVPNEDSTLVEFDEGNLWSLDRFIGADAVERGWRLNAGATWTRYAPSGWSVGVTAGRVWRSTALQPWSTASGLGGASSNWLAAVELKLGGLSLIERGLFDDGFALTKNELRLAWAGKKLNFGTSYIQMVADASEGRTDPTREWAFDAAYSLGNDWSGKLSWRYDFVAERTTGAGLVLRWQSECLNVDLSLSRRFTSSTSVTPTTDFGLTVGLIGIGGGSDRPSRHRTCGA